MSSKKQNILFVSHQASRSGAPVLLLGIIREIKKQDNLSFRILLMADGELSEEFKSLGKTFIWKRGRQKKTRSVIGRVLERLSGVGDEIRKRYIIFRLRDTTTVFSNTITTGQVQEKLLSSNARFICYIHEMEMAIREATTPRALDIVFKKTHLFLTGSKAVKDNLVANHSVNPDLIKILYYPVPVVVHNKKNYTETTTSFKIKNNIPPDGIIIGVAASSEWRKGFDLFLSLIKLYFNLFPDSNSYFVWMGIKENHPSSWLNLYDHKKYGLNNRTILVPHGSDYLNHMACFDIHLLPSREDPYPLVVLDAAGFAIPTICFSDAGGTPEFVENDCGYCVAYGDLFVMAHKLNTLVVNAELRTKMGHAAREKVYRRHDYEKQTGEIINLIKQ